MGDKILLLGHKQEESASLAAVLTALGYQPSAAPWRGFSPRNLGRNRPDAVLADADHPEAQAMAELCKAAKLRWGDDFPILAMSARTRFLELAELLESGVSAVLPRQMTPMVLDRKLARCLSDSRAAAKKAEDELPPALTALFSMRGKVRLGDLASVHAGAAPRRAAFRRMAPPDQDWRGVLTGDAVGRFRAGKPEAFLRWSRVHLFRLPPPGEYAVAEKTVVRRTGPPLAAAVDRSRLPVGADVYSIVPGDGVSAGFIACLLNSRLMDFYFNRIAKVPSDGRLRPEDLRDVPVPRPDAALSQDMSRTAALLAHYGENPQGWADRQSRDELCAHMEAAVFSLYGMTGAVREELAALHF